MSITAAVVYGTLAYQRTAVWETEITLWEDTVAKSPGFSGGHVNLGIVYAKEGKYDAAAEAFRQAARLGNPKGNILLNELNQFRRQLPSK